MIEAIKNRRSIRKYKEKSVEKEKVMELIKAAFYSPSAHNLHPYELITIKDRDRKNELSEVAPHASFISGAPIAIVILSNEVDNWIEDCSIVAEHIQLEATKQGLGSCWAHIRGHTKKGKDSEKIVKDILSIPENKRVLCILAIGYAAEEKEPHNVDEIKEEDIHQEVYDN